MPKQPFPLALCALLLGAGGCTALERTHDCGGVIDIVNGGLEAVRFDAPDAGDAETYARFASAYDEISNQISIISIEDATLSKTVGSYREILDRAANNSRAYARELESRSSKAERRSSDQKLEKIRSRAKTDLGREAALVRKINSLCHAH